MRGMNNNQLDSNAFEIEIKDIKAAEKEGFNKAIKALQKGNTQFFNGQKHCSKFFAFWLEAEREGILNDSFES